MFATRFRVLLFAFLSFVLLLSACGSSSGGSKGSAQAPIFSTTPPAAAAQGTAYSYQMDAVDPAGGSVTFALTTAPTGATLNGSTISWTPTAAQSRTGNNFVVTATTSEGANATQSWSVSPTGVITINDILTYWESGGPVQVPADNAASQNISAVVPNSDGSLTVLKAAATSTPGVFSIAGVPAGNYWLAGPESPGSVIPGGPAYLTSASTIDIGRDLPGSTVAPILPEEQTTFVFNLSGLDSVSIATPIAFDLQSVGPPMLNLLDFPNTTSLSETVDWGSSIDWSQVTTAFLAQYELPTLGPWTLGVTGPSALLSNVSWASGATNTITQTLTSTPASLGVTVQGSEWVSTFSGASALPPTSYLSGFLVAAEPFVIGINAPASTAGLPENLVNTNIVLAGTPWQPTPVFFFAQFAGCDFTEFIYNEENQQAGITTDETLGTLQYSDPLPSPWTRAETFCDEAVTPVALPNSSATANFALVSSATIAPSSSPLAPIISQVQNPTINSASLFAAATLNTTTPSLSWSAPATGAPYGYAVAAFVFTSATSLVPYGAAGVFYTSQTSVTLPPLSAGNTYVFSITALADGAANIQTRPFRSALPTGYASVVSAPITISSSAPEVQIHGDARVVKRFSQPSSPQPVPKAFSEKRTKGLL